MVLSIIFLEDKHTILLHLSIFYEDQQFFQHRICFSIQPPDYSDPLPTLPRSTSFFLIMLLNYIPDSNHTVKYSNLHEDVKTEQKGGKIQQRNMILICISERTLFIKENKKEMRPA